MFDAFAKNMRCLNGLAHPVAARIMTSLAPPGTRRRAESPWKSIRRRGIMRAGRVTDIIRDLAAFLVRSRDGGVTIIEVFKGDSLVTFIRDADDNLFEVRETKNG